MDTPSHSTSQDYLSYIRLFLDRGGDPNPHDKFNNTLLHLLAKKRDSFVVGELLRAGADLNSVNFLEQTPLHIAVRHRNRSMVHSLLDYGALVNTQDCNGNSVLHSAINACMVMDQDWKCVDPYCPHRAPDMDIINRILEHEATELNVRNLQGYTPLLLAVKDRNLNIVKALVANSADVNIGNKELETPLHAALSYPKPNLDIARELLIHGASITCFDINCHTPLGRVLKWEGDPDSKKFLRKLVKLVVFFYENKKVVIEALRMDDYLKSLSLEYFAEKNKIKRLIIGDESLYDLIFQRFKDGSFTPPKSETIDYIYNLLESGCFIMYHDYVRKLISNSCIVCKLDNTIYHC